MTPAVGFSLQPEAHFLELLEPVLADEVDYFEVTPETTWRRGADGEWAPNDYWRRFAELGQRWRKRFVAHAVHGSFGTVDARDHDRQAKWQRRIARDHAAFDFLWCTDHLGAAVLDGRALALPIALPTTDAMAAIVRERLLALQRVVPDVGVENSVFYFLLGDWLAEPEFLARILTPPRTHLLLDLHNVFTMAQNVGADADEYLARLDLSAVIEIHLSGGADSQPQWLPGGRTLRLDSHDHAVPEPVWRLYERIAPRCPNLRGVTLERMDGSVRDGDVEALRTELRRVREVLHARS